MTRTFKSWGAPRCFIVPVRDDWGRTGGEGLYWVMLRAGYVEIKYQAHHCGSFHGLAYRLGLGTIGLRRLLVMLGKMDEIREILTQGKLRGSDDKA